LLAPYHPNAANIMQKLTINQSLSQKLSPQQIQFIKLLQIPTVELNSRVEEELEQNPALEEGRDEGTRDEDNYSNEEEYENDKDDSSSDEEIRLEDYVQQDDIAGYKMQGDGPMPDEEEKFQPVISGETLLDSLFRQLGFLQMEERNEKIARQLIGSVDADGYIRRELEAIVNDLAFREGITTNIIEVEDILKKIQRFDPPGIAATNLQECLALQLERRDQSIPAVKNALRLVTQCFEELKKKHFKKIQKKLGISEEALRDAMQLITRLNPKPGGISTSFVRKHYIIPDFILVHENGRIQVALNSKNAPDLRVSRSYADMLDTYQKSDKKDKKLRQTASFVKQKLDAAKWFIDAIKQRQNTLLKTMNAILEYQYDFFEEGDEAKLRPMILKDIAEKISMDISTVSRVANSKYVQTDFGIYPLKHFFSEKISKDTGEDVSSKEVKHYLKEIIEAENKRKPLSDDKLEKMLRARGYKIARRTVAKYREQMNIPVARLRKEL